MVKPTARMRRRPKGRAKSRGDFRYIDGVRRHQGGMSPGPVPVKGGRIPSIGEQRDTHGSSHLVHHHTA